MEDDIDSVMSSIDDVAKGSGLRFAQNPSAASSLEDEPGPRLKNLSSGEKAYAEWLKNKSPENLSNVVSAFSPTINSEIMRYSAPKNLLRSRAKILAIKAIKSFDPMSGARLNSWIVTNLQPLSRYSIKQRDVKTPEVAARQAAEVDRVSSELRDELGRDPTDDEIADEIGISPKRVAKVREMAIASVTTGTYEENEDGEGGVGGAPAVQTPSQIPYAQEAVYQSLGDMDRFIFDSLTGMHGSKVLQARQVADRTGLSPAAISQRAAAIARQIEYVVNNG